MRHAIAVFATLVLTTGPALAADATGFTELSIPDAETGRDISAALWYPTMGGSTPTLLGENAAFYGLPVIPEAAVAAGPFPLIVLSHGFGGNWTNQLWLAGTLVRAGFVVAAPNHPGTTSADRDPRQMARLWRRPLDITRVIDAVEAADGIAGAVATDAVGVAGHSLGGWTAMMTVGARFDADRLAADCDIHGQFEACDVFEATIARLDADDRETLGNDWRDIRIGAAVSFDLGMARGFTPESLSAVEMPVLILSADESTDAIPADLESGYLAEHLPSASTAHHSIEGAGHFSFLRACKEGAIALLEADQPGDGMICRDGARSGSNAQSRAAIHSDVSDRVVAFFSEHLMRR